MRKYDLCKRCGLPVQEGEHLCKRCETDNELLNSDLDLVHDPNEEYILHDDIPDSVKKNPKTKRIK